MSNLSVNAIRFLGVDAIEKSKSGHPGVVMGAAPMAYSLFTKQMRINPEQPNWINRDRFILSAGHGSMLLYALLHLSGFKDVSIEEIKNFRQWGSKTPGHPEYGHTAGVDTTTGPLGQGISTATGFAQAERFLAAKYNREGYNIFDHYTYVICGDGDLMEGVSGEAASYAGLQKLDKLIVLYDSNNICLDGGTEDAFTENVRERYDAYGWHTALIEDGTDVDAINAAVEEAKKSGKPSLIEVKTVIGYGSPNKQGTNATHGAPLGAEETQATRENLGWDYAPFEVPEEVYADFKTNVAERGEAAYDAWVKLVEDYKQAYPELAEEVSAILAGKDPVEIKPDFPALEAGFSQATRNSSQDALNVAASVMPNFLGGSADLAHSNMTYIKEDGLQDSTHPLNRNIQFGVREFAMGTILNGLSAHGGLRVYGGTFFVFSDYVKAAMRLSALQGLPVTYVFTHDSIAVGEDGPTHEPIEHLAGLRAMPNLNVFRPADARETQAAWYLALKSQSTPSALVLTRQNLTVEEGTDFDKVAKGAYVVYESAADFDTILLASGSEVNLAVKAAKVLAEEGAKVRVVSVPSTDLFDAQDAAYKEEILPSNIRRRVAVEMAATQSWYKYVGLDGAVIGIDKFGASAPAQTVIDNYGFTVENVVNVVKGLD
ncbi:transketolase [Streptococcus hyointestinalis]|uniref:Transketolase n=1 Tax=Streptococcus hyointestinalis TaxID=1337 RepID=A0A380KCH3_9STRE|nr:transketolase [Streptococcus hyointestinalis]SUN62651.1 transketolase [Streptococcus hyointestinalis]